MTRSRWLLLIALLAGLPAVPAQAQQADPPVEDVQRYIVQVDATAEPEATLPAPEVTDQREAIAAAQDDVRTALEDGRVVRDLATVPYSVIEATPSEVARLQDAGIVTTAAPDVELFAQTDVSRVMIGAPSVWPSGDGTGQTIAILDTGVRTQHVFFTGRTVDQACFAEGEVISASGGDCPNGAAAQTTGTNPGRPCTASTCDHGTHVAGIALADDNDGGTDYSGVAPGASLMAVRVFHSVNATDSSAWLSDVMLGLQHVYTKRNTFDIAAVNLSLGAQLFSGTCNSFDGGAIRSVVAQLTAVGIPVVASSGNDGSTTQISFPACVTDVISVGNVLTSKSSPANADHVSASSNASPGLDLLAPGGPITSAIVSGTSNSAVGAKSGTSMAAPHVAGSIALLSDARAGELAAEPAAGRVHWLHGLLDATGVCITDPGNNIVYRRIQVNAAATFTGAPSALFSDVPSCAWYEDAVNWLLDEGLANGYDDNTFRGDLAITRGAVTNMLWNLYGAPNVTHEHTFSDGAAWIEDALDWISDPTGPAAPDPLAAGYDDGTYRPNANITRGEVSRMLYRAAGSPDVTGLPQQFSDVPAWLDASVRWIADDPDDGGPLEPIATGYDDGTYRQVNPITRAAVARMLQRFDAAVNP